jgi:hypothetical protein
MPMKFASLFIAIALTLGLYYELRITAMPQVEHQNNYAWYMFVSTTYVTNSTDMPANWHSRTVPCQLSGWWYLLWGAPNQASMTPNPPPGREGDHILVYLPEQMKNSAMVASYHAAFYFLICIALIISLKEPLLPMFGTFASILCCTPGSFWPYLMPWDLPTMTIWIFIFLIYLWLKRHPQIRDEWLWLGLVIALGGLFKETVLVTALFLLAAPWGWLRRVGTIICIIIASQILNWFITGARPDWAFSVDESAKFGGDRWNPLLLWPVLFANAGSIVLLPWALWRRFKMDNDWALPIVCTAFIGLQGLNDLTWGVYIENRDWLEIAPLAWVLIGEYIFSKFIPQNIHISSN